MLLRNLQCFDDDDCPKSRARKGEGEEEGGGESGVWKNLRKEEGNAD